MTTNSERVVIPYQPRWFQAKVHAALQRFNVLVFHRRAGKTVLAINELIKRVMLCQHPDPRGHYMAPNYRQVKRIAWLYLKNYTRCIPGMNYNEAELRAIFPDGAEIQLLGGENYDSHRGIYSDFVILDEPADMHPAVWGEVFRPALADRKGGAIMIGTPKGHNNFYDRWEAAAHLKGWYRKMYKVTETGALPLDEIMAAKAEMTESQFDQEMMCSFEAAIQGAIFGAEMKGLEAAEPARITSVPHDPNHLCQTSWDLGVKNSTVILYWQKVGLESRLIDCDAFQHTALSSMIKTVQSKPYNYSQHIAPHDIRVFEMGTGQTRFDRASDLGVYFDIAPKMSFQDGIQATRDAMPRWVIDAAKCSDFIEAMKLYRTDHNAMLGTFNEKPIKDWTTDYADSARYYSITEPDTQISLWDTPQDYAAENRTII